MARLDSTEISLLALMFSFLAVLATNRLTRRVSRHDAGDNFVEGDVPLVPDDLKVSHARPNTRREQQDHV